MLRAAQDSQFSPIVKPSKQGQLSRAHQAIAVLSGIEPQPVGPQTMGLLVAGLHLVCCWRYLAILVEGFESRGLSCLWEIWATAMIAMVLGQVAKYFTPAVPEEACAQELDLVAGDAHSRAVGFSSLLHPLPYKEGQELTVPLHDQQAGATAASAAAAAAKARVFGSTKYGAEQDEEEEEDMATVKRRAQEEAAAKLAKYRAEVQQLLLSISKEAASTSSTVSAQLLYRLADQLFASSINLSEFVELGGVPVVVRAVQALTRSLVGAQQEQQQEIQELKQQQQPVEAAVLPAMLQATWVLLQMSQGPPACRAALQDPECSSTLLKAAQAVTALPSTAARATESTLRNIWWMLLSMCDNQRPAAAGRVLGSTNSSSSSFQRQLLQQYQDVGAVQLLQQLLSLRHGPSAGWVAAAHLGLLMQLGHQQQGAPQQQNQQQLKSKQQAEQAEGALLRGLSASAAQAVLQEDSVSGLCFLMVQQRLEQQQQQAAPPQDQQQQQQLSRRMRVLVEGMLHYLLTFHSPALLQLLIEQQLLGCFASHSCVRLGRLLVCQLLSSKGQEVMAAVEEGYELDVPLALAQVIPLKLHVKIPQPPRAQSFGEIEPADGEDEDGMQQPQVQPQQQPAAVAAASSSAAAAAADDLYTDILLCRLLLQSQRLSELLSAFAEEVQALPEGQLQQQQPSQLNTNTQQQQQQYACSAAATAADVERECSVVSAGFALVQHLMSRDLQLQAAQHVRGDAVSVDSSLSGSTASSSRSLAEALAAPDHSGTYSRVMQGMVPADALPNQSSSSSSGQQTRDAASGSSNRPAEFTLPPLPHTAAAASSSGRQVVFQFGQLQHAVDASVFKKIRHCSKLVHSILGRDFVRAGEAQQQEQPVVVTVLAVPEFTDEANCWVLQCLERWLSTGALSGFTVLQAAKLWVAADFLQVDDLQVACEDLMAAGFSSSSPSNSVHDKRQQSPAEQSMQVAVELCARHTDSGTRLLRLLVQQLLKRVSAAAVSTGGQQQQCGSALALLHRLLSQHSALLMPVVHAELRDRLVTLCMLNAGQDAEDPSDVVG